jgi:hypothetical protein
MHEERAEKTYVMVVLFRNDETVSYQPPPGMIEARALPFTNLTNASAVFEDAKKIIDDAAENGVHLLEERAKPGRRKAS